jgi:hypothetical protein
MSLEKEFKFQTREIYLTALHEVSGQARIEQQKQFFKGIITKVQGLPADASGDELHMAAFGKPDIIVKRDTDLWQIPEN